MAALDTLRLFLDAGQPGVVCLILAGLDYFDFSLLCRLWTLEYGGDDSLARLPSPRQLRRIWDANSGSLRELLRDRGLDGRMPPDQARHPYHMQAVAPVDGERLKLAATGSEFYWSLACELRFSLEPTRRTGDRKLSRVHHWICDATQAQAIRKEARVLSAHFHPSEAYVAFLLEDGPSFPFSIARVGRGTSGRPARTVFHWTHSSPSAGGASLEWSPSGEWLVYLEYLPGETQLHLFSVASASGTVHKIECPIAPGPRGPLTSRVWLSDSALFWPEPGLDGIRRLALEARSRSVKVARYRAPPEFATSDRLCGLRWKGAQEVVVASRPCPTNHDDGDYDEAIARHHRVALYLVYPRGRRLVPALAISVGGAVLDLLCDWRSDSLLGLFAHSPDRAYDGLLGRVTTCGPAPDLACRYGQVRLLQGSVHPPDRRDTRLQLFELFPSGEAEGTTRYVASRAHSAPTPPLPSPWDNWLHPPTAHVVTARRPDAPPGAPSPCYVFFRHLRGALMTGCSPPHWARADPIVRHPSLPLYLQQTPGGSERWSFDVGLLPWADKAQQKLFPTSRGCYYAACRKRFRLVEEAPEEEEGGSPNPPPPVAAAAPPTSS